MNYYYDKEIDIICCEPNCADEYLEMLIDLGLDYDGYKDSDNLMKLIDELVSYAQKARQCIYDMSLFCNEERDRESWDNAHAMAVAYREQKGSI